MNSQQSKHQQQHKYYYTILEQHHIDYEENSLTKLDQNLYNTLQEAKNAIHDMIIKWNNKTDSFSATIYKIDLEKNKTFKVFEKRKKAKKYYQSDYQDYVSQQQFNQQSQQQRYW